jgi:hypothetical protein
MQCYRFTPQGWTISDGPDGPWLPLSLAMSKPLESAFKHDVEPSTNEMRVWRPLHRGWRPAFEPIGSVEAITMVRARNLVGSGQAWAAADESTIIDSCRRATEQLGTPWNVIGRQISLEQERIERVIHVASLEG